MPRVDIPTIPAAATLPGADPETMATSVTTPLERQFGRIAGVTEMTSTSACRRPASRCNSISAATSTAPRATCRRRSTPRASTLPVTLRTNPTYRKVNPADAPIMIMALTSETLTQGQMYDSASTILAQKISQVTGVGNVVVGGSSCRAVRVELNPDALNRYGVALEDVRTALANANANRPKGFVETGERQWQVATSDQAKKAERLPIAGGRLPQRRPGPARQSWARWSTRWKTCAMPAWPTANRQFSVIIFKQPDANIIETVDRIRALLPR